MFFDRTEEMMHRFHWQHLVAWLGGAACALVPFVSSWELGAMQVPVRNGPGYFGFNLLIVCGLILVGGLLSGYWWRWCKWLLGKQDGSLAVASCCLFVIGVIAWLTESVHSFYLYGALAVLVAELIYAWRVRMKKIDHDRVKGGWMMRFREWNGVFFLLLALVMFGTSIVQIVGLDVGFFHKLMIAVNRLLTVIVLVGGFFLLVELAMRSMPKYFRWVPWILVSMVPFVLVADQWMRMVLGRRILEFINGLTSSGDFDLQVELAAGGLKVSSVVAYLLIVAVFSGALLLSWICLVLSRKYQMKISSRMAIIVMLGCWAGLIAEQAIGSLWKSETAWQTERKGFLVNIGIFSPPSGLGEYRIEFHRNAEFDLSVVTHSLEKKPDIYVFMVESMRADVLREDVTPFLYRWKKEECQPVGDMWAASNATHLSWFGFFHSEIPVHWLDALEEVKGKDDFAGAMSLQLLKKMGYEIQVRAVCDLGYKEFGLLNFGSGNNLASIVVQAKEGNDDPFQGMNIPEREVKIFNEVKEHVSRAEGGRFFFTALDAPHYNYYWHDDFDPPFDDYAEEISFSFNPDEETVQQYLKRYWNSCAWVDHQIAEFCDFLKKEGRYDEAIIIVVGDHGEEFQERGGWCHCSSLQPEQTSVPILMKWPKAAGRGNAAPVISHLDVMPSLLSHLGVPVEQRPAMVGKDVWSESGNSTSIITTSYAGKDSEAMLWRNDDYEAAFSWSHYWDASVPRKVVLERIVGPDGDVAAENPQAYQEKLKQIFPDAFVRYIKSMEAIPR